MKINSKYRSKSLIILIPFANKKSYSFTLSRIFFLIFFLIGFLFISFISFFTFQDTFLNYYNQKTEQEIQANEILIKKYKEVLRSYSISMVPQNNYMENQFSTINSLKKGIGGEGEYNYNEKDFNKELLQEKTLLIENSNDLKDILKEDIKGFQNKVEVMKKFSNLFYDKKDTFYSFPSLWPIKNGWGVINKFKTTKRKVVFDIIPGTPVISTAQGTVKDIKKINNIYRIKISHKYGFQTIYSEIDKVIVKKDQLINKKEIIGFSSLNITYQVKIALKYQNPMKYIILRY